MIDATTTPHDGGTVNNNRATAVLRSSACVLAALLAGCSSPPPRTAIEMSDSGVFVPTVRASVDLRHRGGAPSEPKQGHAVEFGWSRGSGEDTQTLGAGQAPIVFAGRTFTGPSELQHEFDFSFVELAYRYRYFAQPDQPGLELLVGLAEADLGLTVSSPGQRATGGVDNAGVVNTIGVVVPVTSRVSAQGRFTYFWAPSEDVSEATRLEVYGVWAVVRNAALRAGYTFWRVKSDREGDSLSSIKLRFSGPSLGLDIAF